MSATPAGRPARVLCARLARAPPIQALLALAALVLAAARALGQMEPDAAARIEGSVSVTVSATRLKHWGVPGAEAVFVPDADRSAFAERIRSARGPRALCAALPAAAARDPRIASASVDGDSSLDHRSGDEEIMSFLVVANARFGTRGTLYVCSHPAFALMSRGAYPGESFYQVGEAQTLWCASARLALRPGASLPVRLAESLDASEW